MIAGVVLAGYLVAAACIFQVSFVTPRGAIVASWPPFVPAAEIWWTGVKLMPGGIHDITGVPIPMLGFGHKVATSTHTTLIEANYLYTGKDVRLKYILHKCGIDIPLLSVGEGARILLFDMWANNHCTQYLDEVSSAVLGYVPDKYSAWQLQYTYHARLLHGVQQLKLVTLDNIDWDWPVESLTIGEKLMPFDFRYEGELPDSLMSVPCHKVQMEQYVYRECGRYFAVLWTNIPDDQVGYPTSISPNEPFVFLAVYKPEP
jgi:hypothetical protein